MKKNERMQLWLESRGGGGIGGFPEEYVAFFECFNAGAYYEAHEVLEHLWLQCSDGDRSFYQALIQLAGAFVHFQKQCAHPGHPVHGRRLGPGERLLRLASARLGGYPPAHRGLEVDRVRGLCERWGAMARSGENPLREPGGIHLEWRGWRFSEGKG